MEFYHAPVMVGVCLAQLNLKDGGVYVDATLGGGGHTEAMLKSNSTITVYGFDQDSAAIAYASKRLEEFSDRVHFIHSNFARLRTQLALQRITKVDGILLIWEFRRGRSMILPGDSVLCRMESWTCEWMLPHPRLPMIS